MPIGTPAMALIASRPIIEFRAPLADHQELAARCRPQLRCGSSGEERRAMSQFHTLRDGGFLPPFHRRAPLCGGRGGKEPGCREITRETS
jgi:hypothetical protein